MQQQQQQQQQLSAGSNTNLSSNSTTSNVAHVANVFWSKQPKANAELFALTYGSLVAELVKDYDYDSQKIQDELDRMGHSIGIRCIEEVLAKSATSSLVFSTVTTTTSLGLGSTAVSGVTTAVTTDSTGTAVDSTTGSALAGGGGGGGGSSSSSGGHMVGPTAQPPSVLSSTAQTFYESADLVKIAFRMFFGIIVDCSIVVIDPSMSSAKKQQQHQQQTVTNNSTISLAYSIKFIDNPLTIFVELPDEFRNSSSSTSPDRTSAAAGGGGGGGGLEYSQLLAGMVRGMLEMLQLDCNCYFVSSILNNNNTSSTSSSSSSPPAEYNEIRVELKQILQDGAGDEYHEE